MCEVVSCNIDGGSRIDEDCDDGTNLYGGAFGAMH